MQRLPPSQTTSRPRANTEEPASTGNQAQPDVQNIIQQLIGGLGEFGQNATFNTTTSGDSNGMEVHIDLGNVSQIVNENDIRSRIRNIRRFLSMAEARLNRLNEIQSGAPLDDTPNSTIIVGSIQTTTALTDGNNIIGFETNSQNIRGPIDPRILSFAGVFPPNAPASEPVQNQTTEQSVDQPAAESEPSQPSESAQAPPNENNTNQSIGVEVLAEMTQSVMDSYSRFLPYLQQYQSMLLNDSNEPPESPNSSSTANTFNFNNTANNPNIILLGGDNRRQRFCNNINDMMHLLGHLFHNLSDLHVNIRDRPPRQMHTMSSMSHASSAIIGTAVPVEATIQIPLHVGTGSVSAGTNAANQIFVQRRPRSTQSVSENMPRTAQPVPRTMPNPRLPRPQLPFSNYSTANSYDQYLPCNSVHFYNSYQPGQQGQQRRRQNDQPQPSQQPSANVQQANDISRLLNNILSSTLRNSDNRDQIRVNVGTSPGQINVTNLSENTTPTTQTPTSTPLINSPRGSSANMANLGSMLFGNSNPFSQLFNNRPSQPSSQDRVTGAILREALNLMDSPNQNESRLNQPLREFMRMFGSDEQEEEITNSSTGQPSMLNSFNIFFQSLTIRDMIDLARGGNRHRVFEQTRQPLRQYILDSLNLSNESFLTPAHVSQMADRFYTDIIEDQNGLDIDFNQFELIDDKIELKKSFESVFKTNFKNIFNHIFDDSFPNSVNSSDRTWSLVLFEHFQKILSQTVNLFRACVRNADTKLLQLAVEKIRVGISSGNSGSLGALFGPFESFIRNHVQEILNGVTTDRTCVENLIVYKQEKENTQSMLNADEEFKSMESVISEAASSTLSGSSMDIDEHFNQKDTRRIRPEWLPIIEHDSQKQVENRERSFSDAYCSGMPAKKRKILSSKNDLMKENLFKRVLERTLENIQLKSDVIEEEMIEQTLKKSQLIDYFDEEFDLAITERLRNDTDLMEIIKGEETSANQPDGSVIYNKGRYSNSRKKL